ncbi:MAG: glutamate-cysteine ligase [Eubacterium sp.]|nr:glutamate-cysteine ligase [Eubacterium sp.]
MLSKTNTQESRNLALLKEHFLGGCKSEQANTLGIEIEHIIVHKDTMLAVTYGEPYGIAYILEKLMEAFPDSETTDREHLLGFSCKDFVITLEPASQLEISIAPQTEIARIEMIYKRFYKKLEEIISPLHYLCTTYGYQPASTAASLPLIPKKRYEYMDLYFSENGNGGMQMMRGTASTQISLDYSSETDFRRRYQAAYLLMPVFKLLTDHTPVFEGQPNHMHLRRTNIWNRVDHVRTGILSCVFHPAFGFDRYLSFLWDLPLIFVPEADGTERYTGNTPARELFAEKQLTRQDILHILSMAFPDVRLKNYIEVRGADSLPLPLALSYVALTKGLLYSPDVLSKCQMLIHDYQVDAAAMIKADEQIMQKGWDSRLFDIPIFNIAADLFAAAKQSLPKKEQDYLLPLMDKMRQDAQKNNHK